MVVGFIVETEVNLLSVIFQKFQNGDLFYKQPNLKGKLRKKFSKSLDYEETDNTN